MYKFMKILMVVMGLSCLSDVSYSKPINGDLQAAHEALNVADYSKALNIFRKLADEGDPYAQYMAAGLLNEGKGGERDLKEIVYWLQKSANQGHAASMDLLADYYARGEGVALNSVKAFQLYTGAAQGGFIKSPCNLVSLAEKIFDTGSWQEFNALEVDFNDLVPWSFLALSDEQNRCFSAENYLGDAYRFGLGLPKNIELAITMYKSAAEAGHARAQTSLGSVYANGQGEEVDKKKARVWFEKAAAQGDKEAIYNLGVMQEQGTAGFKADEELAFKLYSDAAHKGSDLALNKLGEHYAKTINTNSDVNKFYFFNYLLANIKFKSNHNYSKIYTRAQAIVSALDKEFSKEYMAEQRKIADTCLSTRFKTCDFESIK